MANYLLIASRDPFDANGVPPYYDLAAGLASAGHQVTLFLVHNGVLSARRSAFSPALGKVALAGATILADDFSLRERGIGDDRLIAEVTSSPLDLVIDEMAAGHKILWD